MMCRLQLQEMGRQDESMLVFSFWPDVIMIKEVGDPMTVADYLGLTARSSRRGRSGPGKAEYQLRDQHLRLHPFFIQGWPR